MNLLGHTHVARATGNHDPEFALGALLPDLVSMAGVRIDRSKLADPVRRGVELHHRTDAVFHVHPAFLAGMSTIRRAMTEQGMLSGPARAVGHVGWELLLDGTMVGTATEDAFRSALDRADQAVAGAVTPPDRWAWFLRQRYRMRQLRYDDPDWVAERLHRMLEHRPLLRFPETHVAGIAVILAAHVPEVAAAAESVLADTAAGVSARD